MITRDILLMSRQRGTVPAVTTDPELDEARASLLTEEPCSAGQAAAGQAPYCNAMSWGPCAAGVEPYPHTAPAVTQVSFPHGTCRDDAHPGWPGCRCQRRGKPL